MLGQFPDRVYHFLTNKKRPRHEELFWPRKFLSKRFQEGQALDGPNLAFFDSQNVTGLQSGAPEKLHFLSGLAFLRTSLHCRCGCGCGCRCRLLYGVQESQIDAEPGDLFVRLRANPTSSTSTTTVHSYSPSHHRENGGYRRNLRRTLCSPPHTMKLLTSLHT